MFIFNMRWELLVTKKSLANTIQEVTGVPKIVLENRRELDYVPIATRMSWASCRTTKCREDIAYCLLGIFNINMPMLYGEGMRAFTRLQEKIIKQSADMSIFLWVDPELLETSMNGLLATSPAKFRDMGTVVERPQALPPQFHITNRGIAIKSRFGWASNGKCTLDLAHRLSDRENVGVVLARTGRDFAVRACPKRYILTPEENWGDREKLVVAKLLTKSQPSVIESSALSIILSGDELKVIDSDPPYLCSKWIPKLRPYPWYRHNFSGHIALRRENSIITFKITFSFYLDA
jgi:hypothetical protein